jgi:hypothetical protein
MKTILTGALAALTMGGALAASTVPASAEPRGGHWNGGGRGDRDGWRGDRGDAVGAGLLGLALGAALTGGTGYGYAPGYYAPPYYAAPRCRVEMRWDPRWGGYDRVRVCY